MVQALFDINADGGNQGFAATNSQVLTLRLRQQPPLGVASVLFQVFDPAGFDATRGIAANPPRASLAAPALTVVGATSGPSASPATVDGSVTITMPATGTHSYIVRCVVNGGFRTLPNGTQVLDPTLIQERGVYIPTVVGARKVVCTELRQFSDGGWADALGQLPDFIVADHSVQLVKLPLAATAPSVIGATANGDFSELPISTFRGVGMTVNALGKLSPRPRPRLVQLRDQFITGGTTSGNIGQLNWNLLGAGTPLATRSSITSTLGNSEKVVLETSATINDRTVLCLGDVETRAVVVPSEVKILQTVGRIPSLVTRRWFFGLQSNFATEPSAAVNALGIYYDSAVSPNYQIIARSSSVGTPTVTSAVVPTNVSELLTMYQRIAGTFEFYSGSTLIGSISSGVPTTPINLGYRLETLAAGVRSCHVGAFFMHAECDATANASDDDTFLEA